MDYKIVQVYDMAAPEPPFGALPASAMPEEEKKHGFFGGKREDAPGQGIADLSMQISNLSRRLRILEERYTTLRKKTQDTDQMVLSFSKEVSSEMKASHSELVDFRREFYDLRDKVKLIVKELKECAKADELKVLERYLNLWEPMQFVTRNEVDRLVEEKIDERLTRTPIIREE